WVGSVKVQAVCPTGRRLVTLGLTSPFSLFSPTSHNYQHNLVIISYFPAGLFIAFCNDLLR
ncbi:MAG: hypothetical protein KME43_26825, partial [Myxacorys chilensis ATA2-1-KO14]|nr:hypothetical protein [Myxacorys chilensis ATA2-1-KO14]